MTEDQALQCLRLGALEFLAMPVPLEVLGGVLDHVVVFADSPDERPRERRGTAGGCRSPCPTVARRWTR